MVPVGFPITGVRPSVPDAAAAGVGQEPPSQAGPVAGASAAAGPPSAPPAADASAPAGGGVPPMLPPPASNPPTSAAPTAAAAAAAAASPPQTPTGGGGGGGVSGLLSNLSGADKIRHRIEKATRGTIADYSMEAKKLCEQLTAWSTAHPFLVWAVGGAPPTEDEPSLLYVSSNVGLGFIPFPALIPDSGVGHVFAHGLPWAAKIGWLGDPVRAVVGFGNEIGRPVDVVAASTDALDATIIDLNMVRCLPTAVVCKIPEAEDYHYPRNRLTVVDETTAQTVKKSGLTALLAGLPAASGPQVEPDSNRSMALWTTTVEEMDRARSQNAPEAHLRGVAGLLRRSVEHRRVPTTRSNSQKRSERLYRQLPLFHVEHNPNRRSTRHHRCGRRGPAALAVG